MSYDIRFKAKIEGVDKYVEVGECNANITWNVRKIITLSTGLPWKNCENNGFCKDVMPMIAHGLQELLEHPEKYKPYESPNGWGTVRGVIGFFQNVLGYWHEFCEDEDPSLVEVTTFWIE